MNALQIHPKATGATVAAAIIGLAYCVAAHLGHPLWEDARPYLETIGVFIGAWLPPSPRS